MLNLEDQQRQTQALFAMWRDWVVACGAPMLVMLFSLWVSAIWLPLVTFIITAILVFLVKTSKRDDGMSCSLSIFVMSRVLFISGVVMLALAFLLKHDLLEQWFGPHNRVHAYIPELVIAPIAFFVGWYVLLKRAELGFCKECLERIGQHVEQGFLGRLFRQEGTFQQKVQTYIFLGLTIEGYLYYWLVYYNGFFSATDKLAFVWVPIIVYGLSVIYMGLRYFMLWMYYGQDRQGGDVDHSGVTRLRYLIVSDDKIYLAPKDASKSEYWGETTFDTPAEYTFQHRDDIDMHHAEDYFEGLSSLSDFKMRFMYESRTVGGASNVLHYIVDIKDPKSLEKSHLGGKWYTLDEVSHLLHRRRLAPEFASELGRLYRITMAWKTYDRNGHRRYRIKHYRPAFRMRDIHNPEVDFNDRQWLYVSRMNEDIPFFRLRRWWDRVINGVNFLNDNSNTGDAGGK